MSVLLQQRAVMAERQREAIAVERESYRIRLAKIVCGLLLGVCFWYSVPYTMGFNVNPDPVQAAQHEAQAYEGNLSRQIALPIVTLIAIYMLWRLPKRGRFGGKLMLLPILYIGWALVSFLWSEDPVVTQKRLVVFAMNAFFAWVLARVFSVVEMALLGFVATGTVALISLYSDTIYQHTFAPLDPDYRFTGVMTANYQAMSLLVCIVCAATLAQRKPKWMVWIVPSIGTALVLMYLTRARLSALLCLVVGSVLVMKMARERIHAQARAMVLVAGLMVGVPVFIFLAGRSGAGAAQSAFMMGRTDTENTSNLSNRAPLWSELMESVRTRPWLGFGYEAFWTAARVERVSTDQGWVVPNAHDTYLDQMLSLGAVGAVLYAGMLWGAIFVAWRRYFRDRSEASLMPALLLTWLALTGVAESAPLDPYLPTILAYTCIAKMCMVEGSESESDRFQGKDKIIGGVQLAAAG